MPKQTSDQIALIIACIVAVVTLLTTIVLLWVELNHPEQDTGTAARFMGDVLTVLISALVGYMAGRRVNGVH